MLNRLINFAAFFTLTIMLSACLGAGWEPTGNGSLNGAHFHNHDAHDHSE